MFAAGTRQPATVESLLGPEAAYIVTADERVEFGALLSDSERREFATQFWVRRGSEFKDEFYRRIAVANRRYGAFGPGWISDRGRAYVILGTPHEVEERPREKFEIWRYKEPNKEIELRFTCNTSDGDYALVLPKGSQRDETLRRLRLTAH